MPACAALIDCDERILARYHAGRSLLHLAFAENTSPEVPASSYATRLSTILVSACSNSTFQLTSHSLPVPSVFPNTL